MFTALILSLREGLEAALIIGIVIGALRKLNRTSLTPAVWRGVAAATLFSLTAALALYAAGAELEGRAEEIFEGTAMLLAAVVLTWMVFWMRRQAASLRSNLEADVRKASISGDKALFLLAFLAVGREGFELVLFLIATQLATDPVGTVLGAAAGLAAAAGLGWALFASTRKLNLQVFFNVTNVLLIFFAAGMVAYGVHEFNEAGLVPTIIEHVWDISPILSETSIVGALLKGLFGYNSNPSLTEVGAYIVYFLLTGITIWKMNTPAPRRMQAA